LLQIVQDLFDAGKQKEILLIILPIDTKSAVSYARNLGIHI